MRYLTLLLLLVTCPAFGQGQVTISGLEDPLTPNQFAYVTVEGIPESALLKIKPRIDPPDPKIVIQRSSEFPNSWMVLVRKGAGPGKRTFIVSLHPFRYHTDAAEKMLDGMDEEDQKAYIEYASKLRNKYAYLHGSATLEVVGSLPPPITDPSKPPPIDPSKPPPVDPSRRLQVTYVWEKDQSFVPKPVAYALQRLNAESGSSVVATEYEQGTPDGLGNIPPAHYVTAYKAAKEVGLPALVVSSGATVYKVIKAPTTEQQVMEAIKP